MSPPQGPWTLRDGDLVEQVDALEMMHPGAAVHAVCLAGGSAFGLDAATGVVRFLEERGVGFDLVVARLPIVPTAVIFDLSFMDSSARPGPDMAYEACLRADSSPVEQGCVGAGTGATAGKIRGVLSATKSGLGSSMLKGQGGCRLGPWSCQALRRRVRRKWRIIAAPRGRRLPRLVGAHTQRRGQDAHGVAGKHHPCVMVTDARLDK
jgi:L-aminopeptidase/D-esterase-like protein